MSASEQIDLSGPSLPSFSKPPVFSFPRVQLLANEALKKQSLQMSPLLKTETLALRLYCSRPLLDCWTLVLVLHHPPPTTTCTCKLLQQSSVAALPQSKSFLIPYVSGSWETDPCSFRHGSGVCR